MKNSGFCHLHVHDEHSYLDGFGKSSDFAKRSKKLGFRYLAQTNHGNIDGAISFQKACIKEGIVPIIGCEGYIVPGASIKKKGERRGHIIFLVKNKNGWVNLCKILTYANMEGFYNRPRVDYNFLLDHTSGLIVMTACYGSFIYNDGGLKFLRKLHKKIKGDLYLEIMPHNVDAQKTHNKMCYRLGKDLGIELVTTNDCHYIKKADWEAQEILLAIQNKKTWDDKKRFKLDFHGLHLRTAKEVIEKYDEQGVLPMKIILRSMRNTVRVARKCSGFKIEKQKIRLPKIPQLKEHDNNPNKMLRDFCHKNKYEIIKKREWKEEDYEERLKEELSVIRKKKFAQYFLLVWEMVDWAKRNGIAIGPGRGSVGGSLVAYLLGIHLLNPIKYGLLFSRFIAEDRNDYPDIDIDFDRSKGHLIREHLEDLYGEDNVFGVSTFQRMKSRQVVKDVARVFEVPLREAEAFSKVIDDKYTDTPLEDAIKNTPEGRKFRAKYPKVIKFARKLEGQVRGVGQHAAAIVVTCGDVERKGRCNLVFRNGILVANWDMEDVEFMGLMKLDVLMLKNLSVLSECIRLVKENYGKEIRLDKIGLNSKAVFKEMGKGHNVGVFQLGTRAMTNLVKKTGIRNFDDIPAAIALVRPGPADSGMTEEYIKRRKKKKWKKKHPLYEEVTKDTYGVIVYQEQVMGVINKVAGLPYSTADRIRKIIGKKRDRKEFEPFRKQFIKGCLEQETLSKKEAQEFWEGLQEHARYSFNLSHSVGYAVLGYWMAWMKYYYPTEFICASLTYGMEREENKSDLVREAERLKLKLITPKIGISDSEKWVAKEGKLFIPFLEVDGIGDRSIRLIEEAVAKGGRSIKGFGVEVKSKGFYNSRKKIRVGGKGSKLDKILCSIGAYDKDEVPVGVEDYFSFNIPDLLPPSERYPKLKKLIGIRKLNGGNINDILQAKNLNIDLIQESKYKRNKKLFDCKKCSLRSECRLPVHPSAGKYNLFICGEAPGRDEDLEGEGFVGKAGKKILWPAIKKYGLKRKYFHVTNMDKCYPRVNKTPEYEQIVICRDRWLRKEIEVVRPVVILAFGNTSMFGFAGRKGGITTYSGTTEWIEEYGAWICWCVHPAALLRGDRNKKHFKNGIKNFNRTLKAVGWRTK